tara:strand:- start:4477 stop:5220 length:744 start_codon:yes stop_codon:yes gene_type:complete
MSSKVNKTLTFDEKVKGWTSFHSFFPEYMVGMNNKFFTFNNGELYEHHSDNVSRNNYYGIQYSSTIDVMVNDSPSEIKELQAVSLEGNASWEALIQAYISNSDDAMSSSITAAEFVKKEGIWYAYARRNESDVAFDSKATYGLGTISGLTATTFELNGGSTSLCIGDTIVRGSNLNQIGVITAISGSTITLDTTAGLVNADFVVGMKDSRIEGGNLRGYTMRVGLSSSAVGKVELFAVNLEVMKSFS